ncbi:MAG: helix-turn-helix domain-containing protein [Pirellulales bacterium]|nr:helix-turn-helix domain-containing protein [Pirellulales bacterium]
MSAGTPVSPALLTPRQAAERLAISPRKLWALTASGEVASVRIGRAVRYDAADLADFIERAKQ